MILLFSLSVSWRPEFVLLRDSSHQFSLLHSTKSFPRYLLCLALAAFPPQSSTCLLRVHIGSCCRARELGTRAAVYGVRQASAVLEAPLRTIQARQQITINLSQGAPTVIEAHLPVGWCTKTALCLFGSPGMDGCGSGSDPFGSND